MANRAGVEHRADDVRRAGVAAALDRHAARGWAALAIDPAYADAWADLAQTYLLLPTYAVSDPSGLAAVDTAALARDAADHAVALDPRSSAALAARANTRTTFNFDWSGPSRIFVRR